MQRHQQKCKQVGIEAHHVQKVFDQIKLRNDRVQRIGSHAHQLYTYDTNKVSLCPFDDKRYVLDDKINTLAYGHYNIKN